MSARRPLGAVLLSWLACGCGDDTSRVELSPYVGYCIGFASVYPCARSVDGDVYDYEQFIPRQVLRTLTFEFDAPEAPLKLVAFE